MSHWPRAWLMERTGPRAGWEKHDDAGSVSGGLRRPLAPVADPLPWDGLHHTVPPPAGSAQWAKASASRR